MYKDVIAGVYQFSDLTLGRMLDLAGPETTIIVCSDHGFQSRDMRLRFTPNEPAGPAYWHRKYGIFLAAGPGIRSDDRVYGATLLDIAPTILQMFGLPVGGDMDGRVLSEIFLDEPKIQTVPSWDEIDSNSDGSLRQPIDSDPSEAESLINQFVALGYVDGAGETKEEQQRIAETESKFNLARNLAWCGKHKESGLLFEELFCANPWEDRFILHFAKSLLSLRRFHDTKKLLELAFDFEKLQDATAICFWSLAVAELGQTSTAAAKLRKLETVDRLQPGILLQIASIYNQLKQFEDAERVFRQLLELHPENAEAHMVMSGLMLRKNENQAAADHALQAISLVYNLARAHLNLGVALMRGGDVQRAEVAFRMAVKVRPSLLRAHRWLAIIYAGHSDAPELADEAKAAMHRRLAARNGAGAEPRKWVSQPSTDLQWPEIPSPQRRVELLAEHRPQQKNQAVPSGREFVLVSGLPRSGTSLMMQMLEIGGLPPKTDGERTADTDNPKGYYEWEAIRQVDRKPELLDEEGLTGKAIKVVSALLRSLPYSHRYKVVFMNRPIAEVVDSQRAMIDRLGTTGAELESLELRRQMEMHREMAIGWLQEHPRADVLVVDYPTLLNSPDSVAEEIRDFVGIERLPNWNRMKSVIDGSLYRNRS